MDGRKLVYTVHSLLHRAAISNQYLNKYEPHDFFGIKNISENGYFLITHCLLQALFATCSFTDFWIEI
jgi:hypothetical protein